jgi:ribonuclease H2 subunit B
MLLHVPVDPLFLVIPIIESLLKSTSTHFQPLGDLIAQAGVDPSFALPEPFSKEPAGQGFNEDVSCLLSIKSVRRVFKACCEKKSKLSHPQSRFQLTGSRSRWPTLAIIFNR